MIIINALWILLLFLTLFAIALWPVLFKSSKHKKAIFIGSNLIMIIMIIAFASLVYQTRQETAKLREETRAALGQVATGLQTGKAPSEGKKFVKIDGGEKDNEKIFDQINKFNDHAKAYGETEQEVQK